MQASVQTLIVKVKKLEKKLAQILLAKMKTEVCAEMCPKMSRCML